MAKSTTYSRRPTTSRNSSMWIPNGALGAIVTRTFVIEGMESPSNADVLSDFRSARKRRPIELFLVAGADHLSILLPATRLLAAKIRDDRGDGITLHEAELASAVRASQRPE